MGKATDLKRVNGKCNVFRLQQDLHAWNVDGSSTDQLQQTSWIKYWEKMSGLGRRRCAFSDCDRAAEHGGHVWIKGHASQKRGVFIAPICKQCNYCENLKRQRDVHGQHSFFAKVPWLSEQNIRRIWQTLSGEFQFTMTTKDMIQTTTRMTIGTSKFARIAVSTFHLALQSITQMPRLLSPRRSSARVMQFFHKWSASH